MKNKQGVRTKLFSDCFKGERDENEIKERYTGVSTVSVMFIILFFIFLHLEEIRQIREEIQVILTYS